MGQWIRQGRIISLETTPEHTAHMQVPTPFVLEDRIRLYYAGRFSDGRSYPAYVEVDRKDPSRVLKLQTTPVMTLGLPGNFDSDGIMPGMVRVQRGFEVWMYYTGWNAKSRTARYHNAIGLAVSTDGGETFTQKFPGPVVDRTKDLPGLAVTPCVIHFEDKNQWDMWYISGVDWKLVGGRYEPRYVIRQAHSLNGEDWQTYTSQCVASADADEAFSNPSVVREKGVHHMWYCYRGSEDYRDGKNAYRIGYAYSRNGRDFIRADDKGGLDISSQSDAWDSTMACYPKVIDLDGRRIMFYNGNSFGQTGIGYAVWEE